MSTESSRLKALLSYDVLDTPPEPHFDDIVQLARTICSAPVSLVSLVAADRQWFKARAGVEITETPLDQSVCAHAIKERELLVIPDLSLDPRTRANPLVTGPPHIRFYAGAVLRTQGGEALGALCVIDTVPRPDGLTPAQVDCLKALGRQTMALLQFRRSLQVREDLVTRSFMLAEAADHAQQAGGIGTFEIDIASDTLHPTPEFCRLFGLPSASSLPADMIERLVVPEDRATISSGATRRGGHAALDVEYRIRRPSDGELRWIARRGEFEHDGAGQPVRLRGAVQDVTERKNAELVQQTLNNELSHRMKNTLAMVDAIANQTLRNAADQESVRTFSRRVQALGRAHDILLRRSMAGAAVHETVAAVAEQIADLRRFRLNGPDLQVNARSVLSFSLLIHELATNALKYGALARDGGRVLVDWRIEPGPKGEEFALEWREEGGPPVVPPVRRGFGSRLIEAGFSGTDRVSLRYLGEGLHATFHVPLPFITG